MLLSPGRGVIAIHCRSAAGSEQYCLCLHKPERAGANIDEQHAGDATAVRRRDQSDGAMLFQLLNIPRPDLLHKSANNFNASQVTFVHCPVKGLAGKGFAVHGTVRVAVKEAADFVFQLADAFHRRLDTSVQAMP